MSADTGARERLADAIAKERCNGCGLPRSEWGPVCGGMLQGDNTHYHSPEWWRNRALAAGVGVPPDAPDYRFLYREAIEAIQESFEAEDAFDAIGVDGFDKTPEWYAARERTERASQRLGEIVVASLAGVGEARPAEPTARVAETMKGQLP